MTAILTAAEMRALEREAIERGEVTGLELMERAGRGVVEAILAEWPGTEEGARRAAVLCGPGNNGGDGFVVARLLKERGWAVEVFLYGDAERLPPDARVNHDRWATLGAVHDMTDDAAVERLFLNSTRLTIVIDALFGIGLSRPIEPALARRVNLIGSRAPTALAHWVAVDIVSGVCSDSGRVLQSADLRFPPRDCDLVVTFHRPKPGHFLGDMPARRLTTIDIGIVSKPTSLASIFGSPDAVRKELASIAKARAEGRPAFTTEQIEETKARALHLFPDAAAKTELLVGPAVPLGKGETPNAHKYGYGHAVILAGGAGKGGAARMTARGALRIGAGLVTLAVPPGALQENAARLDAIMLRSVKDPKALEDHLSDPRLNALCVGPGFGTGEQRAAMLSALLDAAGGAGEAEPRPVVLDADALTLLSRNKAVRAKLHDKCILTPHEGEFARLFPAIAERWRARATTGPAYSKVDAARDAAKETGCVVLLKGPDTVIADPTGRAAINAAAYDRAAPWLATAGSGDVLAGFIAGLLARGSAPFDAACTAAWLHVECARSFGPGLIAEDLPEELPKVFRALGL